MSLRLAAYIRQQEQRLSAAGIDNPALDARLLIGHALGFDRARLISQSEHVLTTDEMASAEQLIERRARREPVARIIGEREFWSLPFGLNEATLEPRPDSETLIEAVLKEIPFDQVGDEWRILDLGTGTGCLLLSLLHELPKAKGLGLDIAPRAVEQAQANAVRLGLLPRATFRVNDWLADIQGPFDIIISNPPYITKTEIAELMPEVRDYDPLRALDGGEDGYDAYRFLIPQLSSFLTPNGFVVFEVGVGQAGVVCDLCRRYGLMNVTAYEDLGGVERAVLAYRGTDF